MWKCVVLTLSAFVVAINGQEWLTVDIDQGPVRGRIDPNGGLYRFYNIPYATAPTGRDKFKPPLPPPTWTTPFDAIDRNIRCPQVNQINRPEDCLVTNLYVPTGATNLPVVVSIHGGAYQVGWGNNRIYRNFVRDNNVIMVTFNYRLAVHGFLCLGTEGAPGNAGLKDQVAALRWVNRNIAKFGGNPEDVTIMACSAGGGSADMLTLSSITKGLFQRAIIGSGASTGAVGVQIDPIENAKAYAKLLNFNDVDNIESLEEFYRTASFATLTSQNQAITNNEDVAILFSPCVEKDIGQERVISDAPMKVIESGNYTKVPLLYGFADMEGLMRLPFFDEWKVKMNDKFSDFLPAELYFENATIKEEVAKQVKEFYFGDKAVSEETVLTYINYFTDTLFGYPMINQLTARVESLGDTIYLYEYSFVEESSPGIMETGVSGSNHCEQTQVIWDQTNPTVDFTNMANTVRQYFVNFIKTGSPTPPGSGLTNWPPANAKRTPHMLLGNVVQLREDILETSAEKARGEFWDGIYEKYYRGPVLPAEEPTEPGPTTPGPTTAAPGGTVALAISKCVLFTLVLLSVVFNM